MRLSLVNRLLLVAGAVFALASISVARTPLGIRSVDFRNFKYAADGTNLVLHDGKYYEGDSGSWRSYTLLPVKYVDFSRDGNEEAFVVLDYRTSGTYDHGQEYFVFAYKRGIAQMIFHESREKPFDYRVAQRKIVIAAPYWKDGGLCCPRGIETTVYSYRNGHFIRTSTKRRYMDDSTQWWLRPQRA